MGNSKPKKTTDNHGIPDDLSIPDFLRRAVAEASQVIAEIDQAETEFGQAEARLGTRLRCGAMAPTIPPQV